VPAVVQAWYGGAEAGPAVADVLTGVVEPSGRLPFSVPQDEADLPPFDRDAESFTYDRWHGWWHLARTGRPAAFPFGFGLAYSPLAIGEVSVVTVDERIVAGGVVRNTGSRATSDVVQVYADRPDADVPARLVGFTRVEVPAGGETAFSVDVPLERLATRDSDARAWRAATGRHRITVARHSEEPGAATAEVVL
jgi:beta-glucosidase